MPVLKPDTLIQHRVDAIRDYHASVGLPTAQLDVSGGIDSAVMCGLLVRALGADRCLFVYSGIHSSDDSRRRARAVTEAFGAKLVEVDLSAEYESISEKLRQGMAAVGVDMEALASRRSASPAIDGSLRSCLRAPLGRYANRLFFGGIRHGTGNECEDRYVRFYQKGGDGEVDTNPIAMLSKGEVYQLARALGVPREIIDCEPTHDLHQGLETSHDEVELERWTGVSWTYSRVDVGSGRYRRLGTIERMSRLMDAVLQESGARTGGPDDVRFWTEPALREAAGGRLEAFGLTAGHLESAFKLERQTRHKMNPNCPTLGARETLVIAGILTDDLADNLTDELGER